MPERLAPPVPFHLENTRILITGAAGGIGAATARLCQQLGARMVLSDVTATATLDAIAHDLPNVDAVHRCDVSQRSEVENMVQQHGPFSAVADASGICPYDDDWMSPTWNEVEFLRVMQINVLGPINVVRAVMPGMIERQYGRIALCGSIAGWTGGLRAGPHYAASKGGVHALVKWFAQRVVAAGITVNGVAPGPVLSGMTDGHGYQPESYPMKRMGHPDEIANVLAFLCSPAASYITGTIVDANGGTYLR